MKVSLLDLAAFLCINVEVLQLTSVPWVLLWPFPSKIHAPCSSFKNMHLNIPVFCLKISVFSQNVEDKVQTAYCGLQDFEYLFPFYFVPGTSTIPPHAPLMLLFPAHIHHPPDLAITYSLKATHSLISLYTYMCCHFFLEGPFQLWIVAEILYIL